MSATRLRHYVQSVLERVMCAGKSVPEHMSVTVVVSVCVGMTLGILHTLTVRVEIVQFVVKQDKLTVNHVVKNKNLNIEQWSRHTNVTRETPFQSTLWYTF